MSSLFLQLRHFLFDFKSPVVAVINILVWNHVVLREILREYCASLVDALQHFVVTFVDMKPRG